MNGFMKERRNNFQGVSKFDAGAIQLSFLPHALARLMSCRCSCIISYTQKDMIINLKLII
jgi:hypothetical protein